MNVSGFTGLWWISKYSGGLDVVVDVAEDVVTLVVFDVVFDLVVVLTEVVDEDSEDEGVDGLCGAGVGGTVILASSKYITAALLFPFCAGITTARYFPLYEL